MKKDEAISLIKRIESKIQSRQVGSEPCENNIMVRLKALVEIEDKYYPLLDQHQLCPRAGAGSLPLPEAGLRLREYLANGPSPEVNAENLRLLDALRAPSREAQAPDPRAELLREIREDLYTIHGHLKMHRYAVSGPDRDVIDFVGKAIAKIDNFPAPPPSREAGAPARVWELKGFAYLQGGVMTGVNAGPELKLGETVMVREAREAGAQEAGAGKPLYIVMWEPQEPELMYSMATGIFTSTDDLFNAFEGEAGKGDG